MTQSTENDTPITIVGAGPVGMVLAYQLDRLNVPCILVEQDSETTKWPKMDFTSCRTMEILRVLGLADDYISQEGAVPEDSDFDSIFVSRLHKLGYLLGAWRLPCRRQQREYIKQRNDGSQPAEPGQRCSQIVFNAWLKKIILEKKHIDGRFGWKYVSHVEDKHSVIATFVDQHNQEHAIRSRFLIACDGGGSRVRKTAGIKMVGGPIPGSSFYLVHFKSQQLAGELPFGRFWHAFPANLGFLIDQDGKDTFTAHYPLNGLDGEEVDPSEIVYRTLGRPNEKYEMKIDEILVHNEWRPNFSIAEQYHTESLRVILAGDSAHRNPPHGGFGMNSGVADAFDLGWRLAAIVKGYGGDLLLRAYNMERRPMAIRALERSYRHVLEHMGLAQLYQQHPNLIENVSLQGESFRQRVKAYLEASGPDSLDHGIDLDLRYHSPIIYQDGSEEREWDVKRYVPSTRPGSRAPHVFLKDGLTSIYDLLGEEWTLIQFMRDGSEEESCSSEMFEIVAARLNMPLKRVLVHNDDHVREIWERNLVLVRPDTHVAWRGDKLPEEDSVVEILRVASGQMAFPGFVEVASSEEGFQKIIAAFGMN